MLIDDVARRHGFSSGATEAMVRAFGDGVGGMAQFDHPEFGGSGQWMHGGMLMLGRMSDSALKARVGRLCAELAQLAQTEPQLFASAPAPQTDFAGSRSEDHGAASPVTSESMAPSGNQADAAHWWRAELGRPNASGAQNGIRYAYFGATRRLAIERAGHVTLYDTLDHRIEGVAQAQSDASSLRFSSQHGAIDPATLPVVTAGRNEPAAPSPGVVETIEQLADLHRRGILSDAEFSTKKTALLARL